MSHLETFLSEECTDWLRARIEAVLDDESIEWKRFELNLYNVELKRSSDEVILEDVLDGNSEPQRIPLADFREALKRCSASRRGHDQVACPRCGQDWLRHVRLVHLSLDAIFCPECDALWPTAADVRRTTFVDYGTFMIERGRSKPHHPSEIEIGEPLTPRSALKSDQVVTCTDAGQFHSRYQAALASGSLIYEMPPGISDRPSFFDAARAIFPLDPPVLGSASWDALSDSLWEGLVNLQQTQIAIFWFDTELMFLESRSEFETAVLVFGDVSKNLSDPVATVGNPKNLLVVLQTPGTASSH